MKSRRVHGREKPNKDPSEEEDERNHNRAIVPGKSIRTRSKLDCDLSDAMKNILDVHLYGVLSDKQNIHPMNVKWN